MEKTERPSQEMVNRVVEVFDELDPFIRLPSKPPVYAIQDAGEAAFDVVLETAGRYGEIDSYELLRKKEALRKLAAKAIANYDLVIQMRRATVDKLNFREIDPREQNRYNHGL